MHGRNRVHDRSPLEFYRKPDIALRTAVALDSQDKRSSPSLFFMIDLTVLLVTCLLLIYVSFPPGKKPGLIDGKTRRA